MTTLRFVTIGCAVLVSGCATTRPAEKPLLTPAAAAQIRRACNADPGSFGQSRSRPPYISITMPAAERGQDGVPPTMSCVYDRLQRYRYDMIRIENPPARQAG